MLAVPCMLWFVCLIDWIYLWQNTRPLDSVLMQTRLPIDKTGRIAQLLQMYLYKKTCQKREPLQLLCYLSFASRIIWPGRAFVSYLLTLPSSVNELHERLSRGYPYVAPFPTAVEWRVYVSRSPYHSSTRYGTVHWCIIHNRLWWLFPRSMVLRQVACQFNTNWTFSYQWPSMSCAS